MANKIWRCIILAAILLSCKAHNNDSTLEKFDSIIAKSDRILFQFNGDRSFDKKPTAVFINKASVINEFRTLLQQSSASSNCAGHDGTITFFTGLQQNGYLEFSSNAFCPALFLHFANTITEYTMTANCGIFLATIRAGEKL